MIGLSAAMVMAAACPAALAQGNLPALQPVGEGRLRWFGFELYDATLRAAPGFSARQFERHPFVLELAYLREFRGVKVAERTLEEMRKQQPVDPAQGQRWEEALRALLPDVKPGDRVAGVNRPGQGVEFFMNGRRLGAIDDPVFAARFFAIWLSPATSEPGLRDNLLRRGGAVNAIPWRYGLLGMPLAFVALPLYVHLPNVYARDFGVPLATLGALLLAVRLLDALVDPMLGVLGDRLFARSPRQAWAAGCAAALAMACGFAALWMPPAMTGASLLAWAAAALVLTYLAFSLLGILHQSWAAMQGGGDVAQSRLVGAREGMALAGVLLASVLPQFVSRPTFAAVLALLLAAGCWAWWASPRPQARTGTLRGNVRRSGSWQPLHDANFRRLLAVFLLNGIASALPATLILFFVQDRLRAPAGWEGAFLGAYFAAGALSVPLWLRAVPRFGLARCWLAGMLLSVAMFSLTATLGAGDLLAFVVVCALCGLALGADLAMPGALLAGVIERAGERGRAEGVYFGWWNFASKLNLAAAAGLALPLLAFAGYEPGATGEGALRALTFAYCLLPCALKCAAALALHHHFIRPVRSIA